jgi:two-component system sensor histidine kinase CpxA
LDTQQQTDLVSLTRKLQNQIDKRNDRVTLKRLLNQVRKRSRLGLILSDPSTRDIVQSTLGHRRFKKEVFDDFNQQSSPMMLEVEGITFVGPGLLKANQTDYMVFLVKPMPGDDLRVIRNEYPGIFIIFMTSPSVVLCYLFVHGLLNHCATQTCF